MGTSTGRIGEEEQHFLSASAHKSHLSMERKHDAIIPTTIPTAPSSPNRREKAAHPSPKSASHRAAGGTRQPTQLVTPNLPFIFHPPVPLREPTQGAGKGKAESRCPFIAFPRGEETLLEKTKANAQSCWRDALCL